MLNNEYYALKEIPFYKLIRYTEIKSHLGEPNILKKLVNYNFINHIIASFYDLNNFYLVVNYYDGKSLYDYRFQNMTEYQIKFISACLIQAFIYLRKEKIIHRDIRMHNLIFDEFSYLNLIDFSYSIQKKELNDSRNYIKGDILDNSPEIQKKKTYDYNSDYYRLGGSIIHFLIFKKYANTVKKSRNSTNYTVNYKETNYSSACIDFLNKLLVEDYKKRLGFNSIDEMKNHIWFKGFDWKKLEKKKLKSPFKYEVKNINSSICSKFNGSNENMKMFEINSKKRYYKILKSKYEYVNKYKIFYILSKFK